jgi:hypothetical protein
MRIAERTIDTWKNEASLVKALGDLPL